jgi:hypothetical protein
MVYRSCDEKAQRHRSQEAVVESEEADTRARSTALEPEFHLQALIPAYTLIPAGLFIYGRTPQYHVHWIVTIFATVVIRIGNMAVFIRVSPYLIDAFAIYATSTLAANTVITYTKHFGRGAPTSGAEDVQVVGAGVGE